MHVESLCKSSKLISSSVLNTFLFNFLFSFNDSKLIILFVFFYNKIFAVTFDESFAKATGTKADVYNMIIAVLTAITIVVGMRIMGTMLISSLIIFPALISMRNFKTFKSVIICSAIVSVVCFLLGIILSYLYSIPTGASIVLVNTVALILSYLIGELRH